MQSKDSQESSPTPQFKSIDSSALSLLYGPTLTSIHDYWKTITDLCQQSDVEMYLKLTAGVLIAAGTTCCEGIEERTVGPNGVGLGCWEGQVKLVSTP